LPPPDLDGRAPRAGRVLPRVGLQTRFLLYASFLVAAVTAFTILAVQVVLTAGEMRTVIGDTRLALAGVGLAAVALGVLGSFVLSRRVTSPLEEPQQARSQGVDSEKMASRDLHRLNEVGLGLVEAMHSEGVLGLVATAARAFSGAEQAQAVAQIGSRERPWWSSPASPPLTIETRKALEAELGRRRAEGVVALPAALPPGTRAVTVAHGGVLFGWIFLAGGTDLSPEAQGLLSILSGQAATTLRNIQLLEERLQSERLSTIGRMISTIVHDFRNPMTAIRGYAAMIEEVDLAPDKRRECAHLVVEETDRLNAMIDEILEFTRGGPRRLQRTAVTVEELMAKLRRLLEPDLASRGIRFAADLGYTGAISVDVDRMLRALLNIAINALDAMETGGTIEVRSRGSNEHVEIDLADSGRGIPEELQPRIYEPFFTHGKPRGIGLGMSITRKIVEEHGGRILLASEVGRGTTFTVCLPVDATAS
jgi:signal transduction histidine kinase